MMGVPPRLTYYKFTSQLFYSHVFWKVSSGLEDYKVRLMVTARFLPFNFPL